MSKLYEVKVVVVVDAESKAQAGELAIESINQDDYDVEVRVIG